MTLFSEIKGIPEEAIELLEASGYVNVYDIQGLTLVQITKELNKTNVLLDIVDGELTTEVVKSYLKSIEAQVGEVEDDTPDIDRNNIITQSDLISSSFAIPISARFLDKNPIALEKLPAAGLKFISEAEAIKHLAVTPAGSYKQLTPIAQNNSADAEKIESDQEEDQVDQPSAVVVNIPHGMGAKAAPSQVDMDRPTERGRIMSMDDFRIEGSEVAPLKRDDSNDLTRTTRESTNRGVDPSSRRYVKGVLHSRASEFKLGTFAYLFSLLCFILTLVGIVLVLYNKQEYWWAMFSPVLFFIGLFCFFVFTRAAQCPICRQREFALRTCLKHREAHHWPLFGYMFPTAIHVTVFNWFRCIYCGTAVRLKE